MNDILTWSQIRTREKFEKLKKEKSELQDSIYKMQQDSIESEARHQEEKSELLEALKELVESDGQGIITRSVARTRSLNLIYKIESQSK